MVFYRKIMSFFSVWDHWNNNLFFTIWSLFWKIRMIYFCFFSIQNIKSICYIIFLDFFWITFFWWKVYSFQLYLFLQGLIFFIFYGSFHDLMWPLQRIENIYLFIDSIYLCFFYYYPIRRIYIWSTRFRFILWHL